MPSWRSTTTAQVPRAARHDVSQHRRLSRRFGAVRCRPCVGSRMPDRRLRRHGGRTASSGVFTNTTPVDAYRGAGRPEAAYVIERLIDAGGARARASTRSSCAGATSSRREPMPYKTPTGAAYDCGDFAKVMDARRSSAADWDGLRARGARGASARPAARHRHRLLHRDRPAATPEEAARIRFDAGRHGHASARHPIATARATRPPTRRSLADGSASPFEAIRIVQGDTDR